jgi:pimeloyl-ACP methyl ester carboxylesterase
LPITSSPLCGITNTKTHYSITLVPNAGERAVKLWPLILAVVGLLFLALGVRWIHVAELPEQETWINAGGCHTPVTILDPPADVKPAGSVILLHGLSANRRLMMYLAEDFAGHGLRAFAIDLPGHGDSKDAFSFPRAQECATAVVESLVRGGTIDPKTTILVGHSMGGAIAIHMVDRDPVAATIAISPAPMNMPQRMPANLLVFSGSTDIEPLKQSAQNLSAAARGNRNAPEDFAQQRAFHLKVIPHSTHTSLLWDRRVAHQSELWAMQALFPSIASDTLALNLDLATYETFGNGRRRLAGGILGFLGILLLFPLSAELVSKIAARPRVESPGTHPSVALLLIEGLICSGAAVLVLMLGVPLHFLHLYTGDYLASLLLIVGILMLILNFGFAMEYVFFAGKPLAAALVLGFAMFLAIGGWLNWQLDDAWLNTPRRLRFLGLLPITWIFCFAEEVVLGPPNHGTKRAARFAVFLTLRLELFLACCFAYYMLANGQVLIVILFMYLALFSILQRLATDALRVRTGSATAAALFGAILAAWFIAVVFPLT